MDIKKIQLRLRKFASIRDWEKFHSPKNLSMALIGEAAELLEIFQWLTEDQSRHISSAKAEMDRVKEEIADIIIYVLRLADKLDIDIEAAVNNKIQLNEKKYPIKFSKSNAIKYNRRKS